MRDPKPFTWGVMVLAVAALVAGGCAKKAVKSGEAGPPAAAQPPPPRAEAPPPAVPEKIVAEPVRPEPVKPAPEPAPMAMAEAAAGAAVTEERPSVFEDIHFDFDKSFIRPDAKPVLGKIADHLKRNGGAKLLIEGHCDERGTSEYNMALGERRAESARSYLGSLGIAASRLSTVSFGEERPADPGHDEAAWAKNRRAHFVLK